MTTRITTKAYALVALGRWLCWNCGHTGNTGKYCVGCGAYGGK